MELSDRSDIALLAQLATQLRADAIRASTAAGSGHPTSSMSAADLMAVLLTRHLRYDWEHPDHPDNDHFILSKGHASPLLYAAFKAAGVITDTELMTGYRRFGCRLQGHPTPVLPWVDVASGSLGQGIANGVGVALAGKFLDMSPFHVWALCGDSEMAEGSVWEALDKAGYYGLANFTVIVDVNRLGQRGPTELGWDLATYTKRVEAFGARAITVDGHHLEDIDGALTAARQTTQPTVILAKTIKGRGFSEVEDQEGWHGKAFPPETARRALAELGDIGGLTVTGPKPAPRQCPSPESGGTQTNDAPPRPRYKLGEKVATRAAYGAAVVALGAANPRVVALDGEVSNSTGAAEFAQEHPDRYFEMFIAEQQLVASAVGLHVRHYIPFASTFAAFFTRAHDFIRMAAVSRADICLVGSHAGVEIGADGPSQMALEDLAMMRSIHGATVLYPSDGTSAVAMVDLMAEAEGIRYLRTTRGAYPVLYEPATTFTVGGSHTLQSSSADRVTLIGAGVTVHQCLAAADSLRRSGIAARVIDAYSIKPVDRNTLLTAVRDTGGRLVVAEDHHPEGGLGSAVLEAICGPDTPPLRFVHLAVRTMPGSGTPAELLAAAGIDAASIDSAARRLLQGGDGQSDGQDAQPTSHAHLSGEQPNRMEKS
ncbi:transketolase [Mycolicibacterium agri]|uniref:Transketolase n=1 Tax=Mycolicibacterium agri TaxID=36811 RepID=A0A2A7N1X1_MYCAG|nr:transketolase [Mycolicibacterium agri]PEG37799.1 transketolase [Mycolicibacterium agri]GFG54881.1 transketolase [Mycolicibacterium agri]